MRLQAKQSRSLERQAAAAQQRAATAQQRVAALERELAGLRASGPYRLGTGLVQTARHPVRQVLRVLRRRRTQPVR